MADAAIASKHDDYPNAYLLGILNDVRTIAMVRTSFRMPSR
jgi:hypothetical protein